MVGPFTVTTEVVGPFTIDCPSYDLAVLATVAEGERAEKNWVQELDGDSRVWGALLAVGLAVVIAAWLVRKRWPYAAVLLYACWLAVVFAPAMFSLALMWGETGGELSDATDMLSSLYVEGWPFWILCGIMVVSQILLLALPIRIVKERPIPRRSIWATAIAAATLFSLVVVGAAASVASALWGDSALEGAGSSLVFVLFSWALWAWLFRGFAYATDPRSFVRRLMKWLFRGSILELLIAIPSHIIVRHKEVCCAHGVTAAGLATGLVVMLISFGPGIYFLYADRIRSKSAHKDALPRATPDQDCA